MGKKIFTITRSTDKEDHLSALSIFAAIVDEKESAIINSNRKVVKRLMEFLWGVWDGENVSRMVVQGVSHKYVLYIHVFIYVS